MDTMTTMNYEAEDNYAEEAYEDGPVADVPIAVTSRSNKISLLQMDGEVDKDQMMELLKKAKIACAKINEVQKKALKDKYEVQK